MIPHPSKADKGGEDAYFTSFDGKCFGVFDGVGGWQSLGVDSGLYSKGLAESTKQAYVEALESGDEIPEPQHLLHKGYEKVTHITGSCTACVLLVKGDVLYSANLGDSGFLLVRHEQVAYRTKEQQHSFNFPYQLGTDSTDMPLDSDTHMLTLLPGDYIVAATDGVFDNLFDAEILYIVNKARNEGVPPSEVAARIVKSAYDRGSCTSGVQTPFREGVQKLGYQFEGGKLDDNTAVCVEFKGLDEVPNTPSSKL